MSERDRDAVTELLKKSDRDGDGLIDYGELATALTDQSEQLTIFRMDNREVLRDEAVLLRSQGNFGPAEILDPAAASAALPRRAEGINDGVTVRRQRDLAEQARRSAQPPAGRKFVSSATMPAASVVEHAWRSTAQHPIEGTPRPQPHRPQPLTPRAPRTL